MRNKTKKIKIADTYIGGDAPVSIQSMTNTDTRDVKATVEQINQLEEAGCDIVRLAVLNQDAANAISEIKKHTNLPLVADIHFDYRLAITSAENGIDKLRINPGNIGSDKGVKKLVDVCKDRQIPIRIGVNQGSVNKKMLLEAKGNYTKAMVNSALYHINLLETLDFTNIIVSMKSSSVLRTISAYREIAKLIDYPLHLGVTETGTEKEASIKSAMGIGSLLVDGIGSTIRVSVTGSPLIEIPIAKSILKYAGLRNEGLDIISCPTCGRTNGDLLKIVNIVKEKTAHIKTPLTVAIMGCVVNGPGEAKEADIGIAGSGMDYVLFKKGKPIGKYNEEDVIEELVKHITKKC